MHVALFFSITLYKKETYKQIELIKKINEDKLMVKEKLDDSSKYIGQLNVQIQEIKSIFNNTHKLPETKNDFKRTLLFFINRVFGIANTDWVLFRIINCNTQKTVSEQFESKKGSSFDYPHISNKLIIEKQSCLPYTTVISSPQNLNISSCCILPNDKISNDERVFIQAITNEITLLYVVLNSSYYKSENTEFAGNDQDKNISNPIL